jgi:hypothetical protein
MVRTFRKYHRTLAIIMTLPLGLTILTGFGYTFFDEWLHMDSLGHFLMELHTGEILGLDEIYPILNGLGALGLLVTGVSMTRLIKAKRPSQPS